MVAIRTTSFLFTSVALLASYVNAYGQIAQVVDAKNFCVFLPPADSVDRGIADTEWNAEAFCIGKAPLAKNAGKLNSGFILSAHYLATEKYVQVTGKIDPSKARLNATDEGGQYDIKAPKGSSCAGWKYYVNLVEPAGNTYCMRCCNDDRTCNRGISEKGCAHIIPGDYSGPDPKSPSKTATKKSKTTATIVSKKTTTTVKKSTTTTTTIEPTTSVVAQTALVNSKSATATVLDSATATNTTPGANGVADSANATNEGASSNTDTTLVNPNADSSNATNEGFSSNTNTTPVNSVADSDNASSSTASTSSVGNSDSASSSTASTSSVGKSDSASSSQPGTMLSQNEKVTGQSISGAEISQPSMIAMTIALVVMAMMYQQ